MKRSHRLILLTIVPSLLWLGILKTRALWINPYCGNLPEKCVTDAVNSFDRPAIYFDSGGHDTLSFVSQYAAGAIGLLVPLFLILKRNRQQKNAALFDHFLRFVQITVWNGFFLELFRVIFQRPRPFVYLNPSDYGKHLSHYTSFYSGHTSFTAAACLIGFLSLRSLDAPKTWTRAYSLIAILFIFTTAYTRVMAGRHFPSDVLAAILAGFLVAFGVNRVNPL